jgi:integrase
VVRYPERCRLRGSVTLPDQGWADLQKHQDGNVAQDRVAARHRERQDEFRRQYGPGYRSDLDLIIANPDGTPLKPDSVSGTVSRLCRMLGLPKGASLHTVRHSHASLLLERGVDLATVSERLGHSSVTTTATIYSHAIRGKDRAAAQVWDDLMQQARAEKPAGVFLLT